MKCLARDIELGVCDGCATGNPEWCRGRGGIPADKRDEVTRVLKAHFSRDDTVAIKKTKESEVMWRPRRYFLFLWCLEKFICADCITRVRLRYRSGRVRVFWNLEDAQAKAIELNVDTLALDQLAYMRADDWQPIETAPKDGSAIDLWVTHTDRAWRETDCFWVDDEDGEGWHNSYDFLRSNITPTHWMSIPKPPNTGNTNE